MKYDVIIIGSGLGGLACAHILSKAGKSVLVLEKRHNREVAFRAISVTDLHSIRAFIM